MTNGIELNPMKSKLTLCMGPTMARTIFDLFDHGIISDFSEDGWVLYHKEWYPVQTFLDRKQLIDNL